MGKKTFWNQFSLYVRSLVQMICLLWFFGSAIGEMDQAMTHQTPVR